jgi:hypothetical protein
MNSGDMAELERTEFRNQFWVVELGETMMVSSF